MNKNDRAWQQLFEKYHILRRVQTEDFFIISAKQINEFREARLMTKFDHRANLPRIFTEHNLSILPVTRGTYVIGQFDAYANLSYTTNTEITEIPFPAYLESIDYANIYSESAALNCAFVCGIIEDFMGERAVPTVSGRMGTGIFDFQLSFNQQKNKTLRVHNSQCEIDGGYESAEQLMLVEAKNFISDDFLIRQVYYPYRLWRDKLKKRVLPVFMTYSNDTFSFFEFEFTDPLQYNSIRLLRQKNYAIAPELITLKEIADLAYNTPTLPEPEVPFPQADKFARVIDLLGWLMNEGELSKGDITENYNFDSRQTDYYNNAGRYLGLIERSGKGIFQLTERGRKIMQQKPKAKTLSLIKAMFEHAIFQRAFQSYLIDNQLPTTDKIVALMQQTHIYKVNTDSTRRRRSATVLRWLEWMISRL
ncbi:MAG: hypothetical protein AB8G22_06315 [Saprospiraceae bacterium]